MALTPQQMTEAELGPDISELISTAEIMFDQAVLVALRGGQSIKSVGQNGVRVDLPWGLVSDHEKDPTIHPGAYKALKARYSNAGTALSIEKVKFIRNAFAYDSGEEGEEAGHRVECYVHMSRSTF